MLALLLAAALPALAAPTVAAAKPALDACAEAALKRLADQNAGKTPAPVEPSCPKPLFTMPAPSYAQAEPLNVKVAPPPEAPSALAGAAARLTNVAGIAAQLGIPVPDDVAEAARHMDVKGKKVVFTLKY